MNLYGKERENEKDAIIYVACLVLLDDCVAFSDLNLFE